MYAADPLLCARCGGAMRIIAFIDQREVIEKILTHLGLWPHPAHAPPSARWREAVPTYQAGSVFTLVNTEREVMTQKAPIQAPFAKKPPQIRPQPCCTISILTGAGERGKERLPLELPDRAGAAQPKRKCLSPLQ